MSVHHLEFASELELALARSACRRLLATTAVHLLARQRTTVAELLDALEPLGKTTGRWRAALSVHQVAALRLALTRQRDQLDQVPDDAVLEIAAAAKILDRLAPVPAWQTACPRTVAIVSGLFATPRHDRRRNPDREVQMPNRVTFQACLADGIGTAGGFGGPAAATQLAPMWTFAESVTISPQSRPLLVLFDLAQHEPGGAVVPLGHMQRRVRRFTAAAAICGALIVVRALTKVKPDSLLHDAHLRPARVLILWTLP